MSILMNVWLYISIAVEYISFFFVVFGKRNEKEHDRKIKLLVLFNIFLAGVLIYFGNIDITLIFALINAFICIKVIYNLLWLEAANLFLLAHPMLCILESLADYFLVCFLHTNDNIVTIIYSVLINGILWIYYIFIGRRIEKDAFILTYKMNILIAAFLFVVVALISYFTYALTEVLYTKQGMIGAGLVIIGGSVIFIAFFMMIYYFNVQQKYQLENEILEKYNEQQKKHFNMLLEKEQKTRQFRHDIIAELVQIKNFSVRKEYERLNEYVVQTLNEISVISKFDYDVGNEIVNVILNDYLLSKRECCKIDVKGYVPDSLKLTDRDLCIIVSNLIANAIEAVEKLDDDKKYISFIIREGKIFTHIIVKNTYLADECNLEKNNIRTTKQDKRNHGFGIRNVKNVVRKYGGEFVCEQKNGEHIVEIRIKNDRSPNS